MESELNSGLTFDQATVTRPDVRRAFVGGRAETAERLPAGTKLYKWTQYPLVGRKGISPWWRFLEDATLANGRKADGLRQLQTYA